MWQKSNSNNVRTTKLEILRKTLWLGQHISACGFQISLVGKVETFGKLTAHYAEHTIMAKHVYGDTVLPAGLNKLVRVAGKMDSVKYGAIWKENLLSSKSGVCFHASILKRNMDKYVRLSIYKAVRDLPVYKRFQAIVSGKGCCAKLRFRELNAYSNQTCKQKMNSTT